MTPELTHQLTDGGRTENGPLQFLIVVAHPHDFTHCAATCGIHRERGDQVTVVTVTDGSYTHNEALHDELLKPEADRDPEIMNQTREEYAEQKAEEFHQACGLFGIEDARILGFPEPFHLDEHREAVETLREIFLEVRPQILITQSPHLGAELFEQRGTSGMASAEHNDHVEVAKAVLEARYLAENPRYQDDRRPHRVASTFYPGIYFMPDENDFFVDITDWAEERKEAEALFESQGHTERFARRRIEINTGVFGWIAGTQYAEGFVRDSQEVVSEIPVSEIDLEQASEPREDSLDRVSYDGDTDE